MRTRSAARRRCGASRDLLAYAEATVAVELNAATDNPLVFADRGELVSNGNFHGQPLAFALDGMAMAFAELANISERRVERLTNPSLSDGLPAFLTRDGGLNSGFMIPQYVAAALVSENKVLAHPASVDSIPTSAGQEVTSRWATPPRSRPGRCWPTPSARSRSSCSPPPRASSFSRPSSPARRHARGTRFRAFALADAARRQASLRGHRARRRVDPGRRARRSGRGGRGEPHVSVASVEQLVEDLCGDLTSIRAPRGQELNAGSWQTEAPLRMLLNNLDPEVAEHPEQLIVYGGSGEAARDRRSPRARALAAHAGRGRDTLLVQSGKPVGSSARIRERLAC